MTAALLLFSKLIAWALVLTQSAVVVLHHGGPMDGDARGSDEERSVRARVEVAGPVGSAGNGGGGVVVRDVGGVMTDVCAPPPDWIGCVEYSIGDTDVWWRAIEDLPPSERRAWWPGASDCEPADETPSEKRSRPLWFGRMVVA